MSCRILIVYEKMGMGHLRMARILEEILGQEDNEIQLVTASDLLGSSDIKTVVQLWNYFISRNWIRSVDLLINFAARLLVLPISEVIQTPTGIKNLGIINPDIIICTADVINRVLGTYSRQREIPFHIFLTDISLFIDLVNPNSTHLCYFEETCQAVRSYDFSLTYFNYQLDSHTRIPQKVWYVLRFLHDFVLRGFKNSIFRNPNQPLPRFNEAQCRAIGPLAEKKYFSSKDRDQLRERHGIPQGETVLVASGSLGGKFLPEVVNILERDAGRPLNLLLMCGNDRESYQSFKERKTTNPCLNILPFPFTPYFDEILEISDCAIIRPSAGIFIESLLKQTPVIAFGPAASNDMGALSIIEKYQSGRLCHSRNLAEAVNTILDNKEFYLENIRKMLSEYPSSWEEKSKLLREIIFDATPRKD